jgi:hypothetical protein
MKTISRSWPKRPSRYPASSLDIYGIGLGWG